MSKKNQKRKKEMKEQQGCPRPWRQIDDTVVDAHGRIVKAPHGCSWEGDNYNDGAAAAQIIVEAVNNSQQSPRVPEKISDYPDYGEVWDYYVEGWNDCVDEMLATVPKQSQPVPEGHELYETGDEDAPNSIKDRNGDVALGMCKRCGRAESELSEPCHKAEQPQPVPEGYVLVPERLIEPGDREGASLIRIGFRDGWNACRAEMLATVPKPGNDQ